MQNVLLPVDFGQQSIKAIQDLDTVKKWLKDHLNITLLHCINPSELTEANYPNKRDEAMGKLVEMSHKYIPKDVLNYGSVTCQVLDEKMEFIPQSFFNERDIDMVVLGTSGAEEDDVLSTSKSSEHVSRHKGTYLIIPESANVSALNRILICADYASEDVSEIEPILKLAKANNAQLYVLHVGDEELSVHKQHNKLQLQTAIGEIPASYHEYCCKDMVDGILEFAQEFGIDLIYAVPRHNTFLERFFHLSIAKKLAQHSDVPVMIHS